MGRAISPLGCAALILASSHYLNLAPKLCEPTSIELRLRSGRCLCFGINGPRRAGAVDPKRGGGVTHDRSGLGVRVYLACGVNRYDGKGIAGPCPALDAGCFAPEADQWRSVLPSAGAGVTRITLLVAGMVSGFCLYYTSA